MGLDVVISHDKPRYVLPVEVIPGVPWPPGFREEFNHWALRHLGVTNLVKPGTMYVSHAAHRVYVHVADYYRLRAAIADPAKP